MGRGRRLTPREIYAIQALSVDIGNHSEIVRHIGCSRKTVRNVLTSLNHAQTVKKEQCTAKVVSKMVRAIVLRARTTGCTVSAIQTTYDLKVAVRRVQQILRDAEFMNYVKLKSAPLLSPYHRMRRQYWASDRLQLATRSCKKITCSDEQRINLNGDAKYWADTRLERQVFRSVNKVV